jgi:hypothetical protein
MTCKPPDRAVRPIAIRRMRRGDEPFVFHSWLKACRKCNLHRELPSRVYYDHEHEKIERVLGAASVTTLMATGLEDDNELHGFVCAERLDGSPLVLHFAYTKDAERRRGVFRQLVAAAGMNLERPFFYTAHTFMATRMVEKFPRAVYRRDILGLSR